MTEHPILFSAPLVRAILDGRKTETRRVIRPQPTGWSPAQESRPASWAWCVAGDMDYSEVRRCPYGAPGDLLWVRETWRTIEIYDDVAPRDLDPIASPLWYDADEVDGVRREWGVHPDSGDYMAIGKGRPSIHMPRWASRITLRVEEVRVERLQAIDEAGALAEGVTTPQNDSIDGPHARAEFRRLWDSIYAPQGVGWADDPWVWVVRFSRVTP